MVPLLPATTIVLLMGGLLVSCSSQQQLTKNAAYNSELLRLKENARKELSTDAAEFNGYKDRPNPDGPFNASNNTAFLQDNVPLFLSSDKAITRVYNYRWWMISKHIKEYNDPIDAKKYWVATEFFGTPAWASLSGAIACPAGHQFYDMRWLRDPKYLSSYIDYFIRGSAARLDQRENGNFLTYQSRPESHHFSSWMIDGAEAFLKVHPDKQWMQDMLPFMEKHQQVWDSLFTVKTPGSKTEGMYKFLDLYDGMEFSLSAVLGLIASDGAYSLYTKDNWKNYYLEWGTTGNAERSDQAKQYPRAFRKGYPDFYLVRPTVNCYSYGNLQSLANMYGIDGIHQEKASWYAGRAATLRDKVLKVLWNEEDQFFNTYSAGDNEFGIRDYEARVRESVGYTPWYFNMIPRKSAQHYEKAWQMFGSDKGFNNKSGMTTAEQQHPYYNEQAYAWNGRGWPFQNSVVYKAYANYLRNYKTAPSTSDRELLYMHIDKLVKLHGADQLNIGEFYIPSDGKSFGGAQDYFHSTFPDIVIEDLVGFKAMHEDRFSIYPLLPEGKWDFFYLGNLRYHDHDIDIIWKKDWESNTPGDQSRLCVWVDGKLAAVSNELNKELVVALKK